MARVPRAQIAFRKARSRAGNSLVEKIDAMEIRCLRSPLDELAEPLAGSASYVENGFIAERKCPSFFQQTRAGAGSLHLPVLNLRTLPRI